MKKDIPKVSFEDDDFGCILNCAVRYALGRQTYMPKTVVEFITPLIPHLNNRTLSCFDRDIVEHGKHWNFGHPDIDEPVWMRFHAAVVQELGTRNVTEGVGK